MKKDVKRVGFFKLGKAIKFNENSWNAIGGDCEPKQLICAIAQIDAVKRQQSLGIICLS